MPAKVEWMKKFTILRTYSLLAKILTLLFILSSGYSFASNNLANEYAQELSLVENYLNSIQNFSANFTQESSDKEVASGKFYLSRPGKMKIEYLDGPPIEITVNKSVLLYYDRELEESSFIKTNTTPASFLTRKNISFSAKDIRIEDIKKTDTEILISISKKNSKYQGNFKLVFKTNPIEFISMAVEDDSGNLTTINLFNQNFAPKLKKDLFVIKNDDLLQ